MRCGVPGCEEHHTIHSARAGFRPDMIDYEDLPQAEQEAVMAGMSIDNFQIKDSGSRQQFESGMMRDTEDDKVDFTNLFEFFEPMGTRYAAHMTKGRAKYPDVGGRPNWMLAAGADEHDRYRRSFLRHVKQYLAGDVDEDHAAAIIFNLNGMEYVKQEMVWRTADGE